MKSQYNLLRTVLITRLTTLMLLACGGSKREDLETALAREIDAFLSPYLNDEGITAATVTVMRNGVVVYEKAFGYKDLAATTALRTDALMTTASIVKPVTAAAIQKLAVNGQLQLSDKVFCRSGVIPSTGTHCWISNSWVTSTDSRILDITVADLIAHRGGWNRMGTQCHAYQDNPAYRSTLDDNGNPCDPIQHEAIVQARRSLSGPPVLQDTVEYFMRGDLDYTPGTTPVAGDRYSNFGYVLLGLIVERASGFAFNTYVNTELLGPLGVSSDDFKTSGSLLSQANAREPNYITIKTAMSVFFPGTTVSARDGALNATTFEAAATSITTSRAMAMFASQFKIDTDANSIDGPDNGRPLAGSTHDGFHYGDLPGTAAVVRQLSSGISYAVLMNKNGKFENTCPRDYPAAVREGIDAAITAAGDTTSRSAKQPSTMTRVRPKAC